VSTCALIPVSLFELPLGLAPAGCIPAAARESKVAQHLQQEQ
jgi:hypothetical protein